MKRSGIIPVCLLCAVTLALDAEAAPSPPAGNPYRAIIDRNGFDLKAPPPEIVRPEPPPKIWLLGILKMGTTRAIIRVAEPAKPQAPGQEQPLILAVGQRENDVEVLAIDEKSGVVKVNNHGTVMEITFQKDLGSRPGAAATGIPRALAARGQG